MTKKMMVGGVAKGPTMPARGSAPRPAVPPARGIGGGPGMMPSAPPAAPRVSPYQQQAADRANMLRQQQRAAPMANNLRQAVQGFRPGGIPSPGANNMAADQAKMAQAALNREPPPPPTMAKKGGPMKMAAGGAAKTRLNMIRSPGQHRPVKGRAI